MNIPTEQDFDELRNEMLVTIALHAAASADATGHPLMSDEVLNAMCKVPRHLFVPEVLKFYAYSDRPLPIGYDKTISQPFIVALMCDLLEIESTDRVLEVGTGLGYQAAVLSRLAAKVYTIDIIEELVFQAEQILSDLYYHNVQVKHGNGVHGWYDYAPFDKIIVAASADEIPSALIEQLKPGGLLIMPKGPDESQNLVLFQKGFASNIEDEIISVRFSRLTLPR